MVIPVEWFFLLNYIYTPMHIYVYAYVYTQIHVDVTGTVAKWMRPRGTSNFAWKFYLKSDFSVLFGCRRVTREDEQRMGTRASLEFVGKSGIPDYLQSVLFCGWNLAIWGLNCMRNWVFTVTGVYSSARFHFPELNSGDTSALLSFIKSSLNYRK